MGIYERMSSCLSFNHGHSGEEMESSTSRRGDVAEHVAVAYLLEKGYEVYHNASSVGSVDLVARHADGSFQAYDVKRANITGGIVYTNKSSWDRRDKALKLLFVFISEKFEIVVDDDEKLFLEKIESLGYKTKNLDTRRIKMTEYTLQHSDGTVHQIVGQKAVQDLTQTTTSEFLHKIRKGFEINDWTLLSRKSVLVTVNK